MNSDISRRSICFSLSNTYSAKALESSVLPTPVGPKKRNEPKGLFGSCNPALEILIAFETFSIASFWPITRFCSKDSIFNNLLFSLPESFSRGMPVHLDTTPAISSALMTSLIMVDFSFWLSSSYSFCRLGICPYIISLALVKSPLRCAVSRSSLAWSIRSLRFLLVSKTFFSASQVVFNDFNLVSNFSICRSIVLFFSVSCSFSLERTFLSIWSFISSLSSLSISSGLLSISILTLLAASSIKSMALSGRKRSVI